RAYLLADGYLGQLSIDDSPTAAFAEPGEIPAVTAVVTQVVGNGDFPVQPHTGIDPVEDGRLYLLCSDGLSDLVAPDEIERLLLEKGEDDVIAAKALWAAAMN